MDVIFMGESMEDWEVTMSVYKIRIIYPIGFPVDEIGDFVIHIGSIIQPPIHEIINV